MNDELDREAIEAEVVEVIEREPDAELSAAILQVIQRAVDDPGARERFFELENDVVTMAKAVKSVFLGGGWADDFLGPIKDIDNE